MAHRLSYPPSSSRNGATFQGDFSARDHVDFSQDNTDNRNIYRFSEFNKSSRDQSKTLQELIPTLLYDNMSVFKQNGIIFDSVALFMSKISENNQNIFVHSARNLLIKHNSNHKKAIVSIVDEAMKAGMSGGDGWRCYNSIKKQVKQNKIKNSLRLDCDLKSLLNKGRGRDVDGYIWRVAEKRNRNSSRSRSRSRDRGKYNINKYENNSRSNNYVNKNGGQAQAQYNKHKHNNSNVRGHDINDTNVVQRYDINVVQGYGTNNKQTNEKTETKRNNLRIWLSSFGLCQYYGAFARQGFDNDFALIDTLTDAELREVGVAKMAHRKKILQQIEKKEMILKLWKEEGFEIMCGDDEVPQIVFESNTLSFKEKLKQQSIGKKERENRKDRETMSSDGAATSPFPTGKCVKGGGFPYAPLID